MRCVADSLVKMCSDAEPITIFLCNSAGVGTLLTASQRERTSSRFASASPALLTDYLESLCVHARRTAIATSSSALSHSDFALTPRVLRALEVPLFLASEQCANPRNSIGAICTAARNPARQLMLPTQHELHACKLDALARKSIATLVKGCISYIDTTHESFLHRARVLSPRLKTTRTHN